MNSSVGGLKLSQRGKILFLSGELKFANVMSVIDQGRDLLLNEQANVIDLAGIHYCDSAGLALLTEWVKVAKQSNVQLKFANLPEQTQALLRLTGFDAIVQFA